MTAFMGVRISWLMLAKKSPLALLASIAVCLASMSSSSICLRSVISVNMPKEPILLPFASKRGAALTRQGTVAPSARNSEISYKPLSPSPRIFSCSRTSLMFLSSRKSLMLLPTTSSLGRCRISHMASLMSSVMSSGSMSQNPSLVVLRMLLRRSSLSRMMSSAFFLSVISRSDSIAPATSPAAS